MQGWQREWEAFVRPHFTDSTRPLRPEFVVGTLQKTLPEDVILALDSVCITTGSCSSGEPAERRAC